MQKNSIFGQRAEGLQQLTQKVASLEHKPDEFGKGLPNFSGDYVAFEVWSEVNQKIE